MRRLIRYFTENTLLVKLLVIIILVGGVISAFLVKREEFPNVDVNIVTVEIDYPGASARDVELNAVVPVEEELETISGIDYYSSLSIDNAAKIIVVLDDDVKDTRAVKDDIFRKITKSNIEDLPGEVEKLVVTDINPQMKSVYSMSLSAKNSSPDGFKKVMKFSDDLEKMLRRVSGVGDVVKSGYLEREIHVNVMPERLERNYISLNEIVTAITQRNVRTSGGTLDSPDNQQSILTNGQFRNPLDVRDVAVRSNFDGNTIRVRDLATVEDALEEPKVLIRVNGKDSVMFQVKKKERADIVTTVNNIKRFLNANSNIVPSGVEVREISDESRSISSLLDVVISNAIIGYILVLVILLIFLDFKTSFWTAFGIPLSLCMVLIYMQAADLSLNILSLGAIITLLGMMVDHGIVISDVIYGKKLMGATPLEATIEGVMEVLGPVTVTVTTTMVAFLPLLSISGMLGKFIFVFPVIITVTLTASFIEATLFLPSHLAHGRVKNNNNSMEHWFFPVVEWYGKLLEKMLKYRYAVVIGFVAVFIGAVLISSATIKNFVLVYDDSSERISLKIEAPRGTSIQRTRELLSGVETVIMKEVPQPERVSIVTTVGNHDVHPMHTLGNHENWGMIMLNLVPVQERQRSAGEIVKELRKKINTRLFPCFEQVTVNEEINGPQVGEAVNMRIISSNEQYATKVREDAERFLHTIRGVKNIENDQKEGRRELRIEFDYEMMAKTGTTVKAVATTVRTAYEGTVATSIRTIDHELDFRVQVKDTYQKGRQYLENLIIPNSGNRLIRLRNVAHVEEGTGSSIINHYNGDRVVTVTAGVDDTIVTSRQVAKKLLDRYRNISRKYPGTYVQFGGEAAETEETFGGLGIAFIMAVLGIYFMLIFLFKSVSQPLLIILTIPFGIIGALLALTAHGVPLSFMGVVGIIGLAGVVVNDSVVMVDFINRLTGKGDKSSSELIPSVVDGAKSRLRAVVLTTVTTVAGLLPTIYGIGGSAASLKPAVISLAYGLLFATLLTLIFIPALFMVNNDSGIFLKRLIVFLSEKTDFVRKRFRSKK
ncbi:MAG TPA: efflux RND transporter permease subunit [Spirochaetota bacterium]|nr:efflux RND transporter permease subunit [Spirochaetota bacterium]HPQ52034.1 efflux RND transporter permease subunit [Spirochaetota bacterium]